MNPIVFAIPVFLLSILLEAWWAWRRGKAVYDIPDAISSSLLGMINKVTGFFFVFATLGIYVAVYDTYRLTEWSMSSVPLWLLALLAYDFFYYWAHRMSHEVNIFWASHVVHHSSEYYNLSTALRQTSTGPLLSWVFFLPMAVMGVPPVMLVTVGLIDLLYQYWVHTELIGRMGVLDRILVTPSNHRVHHGQNDYCIDKNYGGILVLWDRLFGTFEDERDGERIVYGVRKQLGSYSPIWGNLHYYADLWRESVAAPGWRAKLGVWVAPPGGWTDEPVAHFDPSTFQRYSPQTPPAMRWYVMLQCALVFPLITHFLAIAKNISTAEALVYMAVITYSAIALSALLEGVRWGRWLELFRLAGVAVAFALLPDWFGFQSPVGLRAAVLVFAIGSAAWLVRRRATFQQVAA